MPAAVFIKKQQIKIHTDEEQLGHYLRKKLNGPLQEELMAVMEKVFSQENATTTYLHIDKLTLDLGKMNLHTFEEQFVRLVELNLIKALQQQFQDNIDLNKRQESTKKTSGHIRPHPTDGSFVVRSVEQQELIALFHFLEKGIFPWWVQKNTNITPNALLDKIINDQGENIILKILAYKRSNTAQDLKNLLKRLFVFLNPIRYGEIINLLTIQYNDKTIIANTSNLIQSHEEILKLIPSKNYHQELFAFLLTMDYGEPENLIYRFLKQLAIKARPSLNPSAILTLNKNLSSEIKKDVVKIIEEYKDQETVNKKESFHQDLPPLNSQRMIEDEILEGIFINNAGLVLLNPFLTSLFSQTGVLKDTHTFVSREAQQKAAVMLFYLQGGDTQYKEWEMSFNKIICGIEVQEVLESGIIISEEEKQQCDELLEAVVHYWEALKGASIQAMQQTFLLREGKMIRKDDNWSIQIERTGADILLERIPWGFSTIKFPWLEKIIYTIW